jgi:ABC-type phosphate/phosphonate transport system ATPase subunit
MGSVIVLYGPSSAGKSTLAAALQRRGRRGAGRMAGAGQMSAAP